MSTEQYQILLIKDYLVEITVPLVCGYCCKTFKPNQLTLDHINPKADGHETSIWNAVLACHTCNTHKGRQYQEPRIRPPVSTKSFSEFTRRMKRENPQRYWPYKYKATRKYESAIGRRIT